MKRAQGTAVALAAVLAASMAVGGSMAWDTLSGSSPSGLLVRGALSTTTTTLAPAAEPAAPILGPTQTDPDKPGRKLRLGVARPVTLPATVADAVGSTVGLYSTPDDTEPAETMKNPTWEGLPVVFVVQQTFGDWLEVHVSMRPNESTAWIKKAEVTLREVPYRVTVNVTTRELVAYQGDTELMRSQVAVGTGRTPTPTGNFFIDGAVKVPDPNGPYGAYQLSVSGFSNVHKTFGGGIGQIAIHGTNNPALIGTPASNGCVRMTNADITRLVNTVPLGTPVQITA